MIYSASENGVTLTMGWDEFEILYLAASTTFCPDKDVQNFEKALRPIFGRHREIFAKNVSKGGDSTAPQKETPR